MITITFDFVFILCFTFRICYSHLHDIVPSERIVSGNEVHAHSAPYMAALNIDNGSDFCGGTLVSEQHILTAAHCLYGGKDIEVILGAHNWKESEDTQVRIRVNRSNYITHPNYNPDTYKNDVGVIKLPHIVKQTHEIVIGTLPSILQNNEHYIGYTAQIYGWGATDDSNSTASAVLRRGDVKIVSHIYCNNIFYVDDSQMCTVGESGICDGDSGGPLMIKHVQVGIVSFGSLWCQRNLPNVYTHIGTFAKWIKDLIRRPE